MKTKVKSEGKNKSTKKAKSNSVKKTSKKKSSTTKSKAKKKSNPNCNLWVRNSEGEMENVSMEPKYKMQFVDKFGVMEIPSKEEFNTWYSSL